LAIILAGFAQENLNTHLLKQPDAVVIAIYFCQQQVSLRQIQSLTKQLMFAM